MTAAAGRKGSVPARKVEQVTRPANPDVTGAKLISDDQPTPFTVALNDWESKGNMCTRRLRL